MNKFVVDPSSVYKNPFLGRALWQCKKRWRGSRHASLTSRKIDAETTRKIDAETTAAVLKTGFREYI